MTADDLTRVHQLDQICFSAPWPLRAFRYELQDNPVSRQWVAEVKAGEGGPPVVIGMIVTWLVVGEVHIATLAVDPDWRRSGIALRLVCTALQAGLSERAAAATLEVRAGNLAAQRLYDRLGFQVVGRRPGYYADNAEDALLLTLPQLTADHLERVGCGLAAGRQDQN
jgi:ribosomal-protein-alanine N-acetyltransferase